MDDSTFDVRDLNHLKNVMRHIKLVQDNAALLAEKLIERGEAEFAINLIANSLKHDTSKFHGVEWRDLRNIDMKDAEAKAKLEIAWKQHVDTNEHHPEYWGNIKEMPRIYIAEMVCDWKARSTEGATGLREWIKDEAMDKYELTYQSKQYKWIKDFVDLLLNPTMERIQVAPETEATSKEDKK